MTSKIVVNNIESDAGISSVTLISHVAGHNSTQNISGINSVTANAFYGDGANLTGITQTTINNNANNRIITGSGTANTLEGEANLIFTGTRLGLNKTSPAPLNGDGTGMIHVAGGNPELVLERTTSGTEAKASIRVTDGEDLKIAVKDGSGSTIDALAIDTGTGNVSVGSGNLVIGTAGKGIDFSATGNISGTQSELLDDFEEGTWTPEINGGYSSISYHNPRIGYYTKVGNHVSFQIYLYVYQATGAAANVQITLPFTSLNNSGRETGAYTAYSNGFMSSSWNEKSGCGYLIGANYSYLRPCKLTNGAIIYGNDTRLGTGANNQYLIICGQMFAA